VDKQIVSAVKQSIKKVSATYYSDFYLITHNCGSVFHNSNFISGLTCLTSFLRIVSYELIIAPKKSLNCEIRVAITFFSFMPGRTHACIEEVNKKHESSHRN